MPREGTTVRSILIIDTDLGYAGSLADLLRPKGYTGCCVDTPERALAALRDPPDGGAPAPVALVDANCGNSGPMTIDFLRSERPELVCVLMATDHDDRIALSALRWGAYDYFDKSRDLDTLIAVLDRCFDPIASQRCRAAAYQAQRRAGDVVAMASRAREVVEAASRGKGMVETATGGKPDFLGFLANMITELNTLSTDVQNWTLFDTESWTPWLSLYCPMLDAGVACPGSA
jgi:DNA-binding NtrC family response regulator